MSLVAARGLSVRLGGAEILRDVELVLEPGELLAVVGPNGSGKTTLARALSGVIASSARELTLGDRALTALSRREIARRLAVVPQESFVPFDFRVDELVAMGRAPHLDAFGREGERDRACVREALAEQGLEALAARSFPTLSGGEKQRVLLARARAQATPALLLDEPTAHMDLGHRLRALEWLRGWIGQEPGTRGAVWITHDLALAARFSDRALLLERGAVAAAGRPEDVLDAERIRAVYRVEARVERAPDGSLEITPLRSLPEASDAGG